MNPKNFNTEKNIEPIRFSLADHPAIERYSVAQRVLHWLVAGLIIAALGLAFYTDDMPLSPKKIQYIAWHKSLGISVLTLVAIRLVIRLLTKQPKPINAPAWQNYLAACVHGGLYVLMFVVPLCGWLSSNSHGYGVRYFGWFDLPRLIEANESLAHQLKEAHEVLGFSLLALVVLHVAASVYHALKKDGTIRRML